MALDIETKMEIELMKKDVNLLTSLFSKFDITVDKLQEIATSLSKMISIQEIRMDAQETASKEIFNILEVRRMDHTSDVKEINGRIDFVSKELTNKIESTEEKILKELIDLKAELKGDKEQLTSRLSKVELFRLTAIGIGTFLAFVLGFATDFMGLIK